MSERSSQSPQLAEAKISRARSSAATAHSVDAAASLLTASPISAAQRAGLPTANHGARDASPRAKSASSKAANAGDTVQAPSTDAADAGGRRWGTHFSTAAGRFWQLAPGWLVSGAVHAAILVSLGLMVVAVEHGSNAQGMLGSFARGDQVADVSSQAIVEMGVSEAGSGDGNLAGVLGGTNSGTDAVSTGTLLGSGVSTQVEISAPAETTGGPGGSLADQIAAVVGKGETLDRVVTGPPPGGGSGPVVGKGKASFFGVDAKGYKFVYIVDASGSMFGPRFSKAHAELIASLTKLDEHQSFYVIFFNSTDYPQYYPLPEETLTPVSPKNLEKVINWMTNGVTPFGETIPNSAISRALALRPDAIFLLSDGEFSDSAGYVVRQENYRNVPIHTIAFESELGAFGLSQIARMTGGTYRFVP